MKNLWLGNKNDAGNEAFLKEHGIKTVFNCTPDVPDAPIGKTERFPIHDSPDDEDIMRKNGMAWAQEIMEAMADGPVLVHCVEGRQRSATLVALIMGLAGGKRLPAVLKELRAKRSIALMPEPTFKKPLEEWLS
jgi:protein-tyrosine phosphatase